MLFQSVNCTKEDKTAADGSTPDAQEGYETLVGTKTSKCMQTFTVNDIKVTV